MEIHVQSPGGLLVDARFGDFKISTDQPVADGGTNTAPSPFDLFLASLATCAGYYVTAFCRERDLPTEGIALKMTNSWNDQSHLAENDYHRDYPAGGVSRKISSAPSSGRRACVRLNAIWKSLRSSSLRPIMATRNKPFP